MVVFPTVIHLQLSGKVLKGIEKMGRVKTLIIFSMAVRCIPVMTRGKEAMTLWLIPCAFRCF